MTACGLKAGSTARRQNMPSDMTMKTFATVVRFVAPAHATEWTADANRIRAVLAC